jgi:dTDP-4-dehydrorhamnose reductase
MILVFGKTGQVASEFKAIKDVVPLGRHQADLSDPQACADAIEFYKPQAVINAAAYTAVDQAENEESLAHTINGEAPGAMAMICTELNIPLVHISTDYVFDGSGVEPWRTSDTPNPKNVYGRSKLEGEQAIDASGCTYGILRASWVVSAHGRNFLKTMLRLSERSDSLNIVDDQVGGPTCSADIAQTCLSIAKELIQNPNKKGIYHYSGQPDVSWCKFANYIFELAGRSTVANPILTSKFPTQAVRPLNSRLDCKKLETTFNITRPYWRDSLERIIKELESQHD